MKKVLFLILSVLASCMIANSQEVMKIEMKNGNVVTYDVKDINRFYFTIDNAPDEQLAEGCEIEIEDEVVLNNCAAFEFSYDSGIDYVYAGRLNDYEVSQYTEEQIVRMLIAGGGIRMEKTQTEVYVSNLEEGNSYMFVYVGFNAQGKRGQLHMHHFTTSVLADLQAKKQIAEVKSVKFDDINFYFTVEADETLVGEYYLLTDVGNDLKLYAERLALIGLRWKDLMDNDEEEAGQNYFGKDFRAPRSNGENSLQVLTWSTDDNFDLIGYIFEAIWHTETGFREMAPARKDVQEFSMRAYSKQEVKDMFGSSVTLYRVGKK